MMSAPTNLIMGKEKLADRAPSVQLLNPIFSYMRGFLAAVLHFSWKNENLVFAGIHEIPLFLLNYQHSVAKLT